MWQRQRQEGSGPLGSASSRESQGHPGLEEAQTAVVESRRGPFLGRTTSL